LTVDFLAVLFLALDEAPDRADVAFLAGLMGAGR
jgi:hypothetical protein